MLNNVDVAYIDWNIILGNEYPDSRWVLEHFYDEVEDFLSDAYGEEGMPFDKFCDWVRFESTDFIAEFPDAWKSLHSNKLLDAEDLINMNRFQGDEEQLLELASEVSPEFAEDVRRALKAEGRLEESYRPRRARKPMMESRRMAIRKARRAR